MTNEHRKKSQESKPTVAQFSIKTLSKGICFSINDAGILINKPTIEKKIAGTQNKVNALISLILMTLSIGFKPLVQRFHIVCIFF